MRIVYFIPALQIGGAEIQMQTIAISLKKRGHDVLIVSLLSGGEISKKLKDNKINVIELGLSKYNLPLYSFIRLIKILRNFKPDILHGWLYYSELLATFVYLFCKNKTTLFWNIRGSELNFSDHPKTLLITIKCLKYFSKLPKGIFSNSKEGIKYHHSLGYRNLNWHLVPNAIETDRFVPSITAKNQIRMELGLNERAVLIGLVARFHKMKDHSTFIKAAKKVLEKKDNTFFLLVGEGVTYDNVILKKLLVDHDLPKDRVILLGKRNDMETVQASLNIGVCSSYSEGFPNSIAEAMSSGVPCVSTDVGEARYIIGDTGIIVPINNPDLLSKSIMSILDEPDEKIEQRQIAARARILANFSTLETLDKYERIYETAITSHSKFI